jgi:cytochrome c5
LNQAVLHTFTYDTENIKRYETPIKLLHGLYGNADAIENLNFGSTETPLGETELLNLQEQIRLLPNNPFDGETYVQPGWLGEEELYHRVYARNCRLCHAQIGEASIDFESYEEFINNERLVSYVFERGLMPLSRLTMDRFWTDFYNDTSAAEFLRQHLNSDNSPDNDVPPDLRPGSPVAIVLPEQNSETSADVILDFDETQLFDATQSIFSDGYRWRLNDIFQTDASKFTFEASTPGERALVSAVTLDSANFISSTTVTRSILVRDNTPNISSVPAQTLNEGESLQIDLYQVLCPDADTDSRTCRSVFGDIREGASPRITIAGTPNNVSITDVNSVTGIVTVESTASADDGNASFEFTITDSFDETSSPALVNITVNALDGPEIGSPDTCTTDAKSFQNDTSYPLSFTTLNCPDPSENDVVSEGLSLSIVSVDGSGLRAGSSVQLSGGTILFEPARFFVGQESFTYTVQDNSLSERTNTGTVLVDIEATQSFASLTSATGPFGTSGSTGCADCHDGTLAGAPNWFNANNVRLAATNDAPLPYGSPEIILSEPTTTQQLLGSILFNNGCNEGGTHPGGNRLCNVDGAPSSVSDLNAFGQAVLTWLEEGAQE